ncbi:hypothetical protein KBC70_04945 [Candidatus Woesebacteria bacterium]|nr:hypothetical protein [Candidatus Woesebacteria bacterium]
MTLSPYHKKYASQPDAEVQNRVNEKRQELAAIFAEVQLKTTSEPVRIAVVGCGDKRYVQWHKDIFETLLKRPVEITTFDIVVDHLQGEENVIQHDCTVPFPGRPFDITYAHVLLRFIETEKQWDLILNSFHTLTSGGLAIHLLDTEDYKTEASLLPNGLFTVPLKRWEAKLDELGIEYKEIPVKYGLALVLNK